MRENSIYMTGNESVDQMTRLQISGNVIPAAWYRTIRKETGKPYLNAIIILSDIVYWYRAAEVRDPDSGILLGYKKRFKSDLLQRSYQQMADQFGISKRDAANAVVELEKLGVIRRVFRTLCINGQQVPNVLFLELDVNMLESLTFPCREYHSNQQDILTEVVEPPTEVSDRSMQKEEEPVTEMSETNTGITNKDYNIEYPIQSY